MAYQEDSYYIDRIVNHQDQVAFAHLVRKHQTMVFNIAKRITGTTEDAEEVTQDTFIKVHRSLESFRGDSKFTSWLYRITWNFAINKTRKKNLITTSTDDEAFIEGHHDSNLDTGAIINHKDKQLFVRKAIDSLEPMESTIITLYYMDNVAVTDIAEITELTEANIKVKLFRARKKIESYLRKVLDTELELLIQ